MPRLSLTLLGGFHARLDDDRAPPLSIKKAQALLAYLSMPTGKTHLRDKLATLLWGEMREPQARGGLRHALFTLRRALGDANPLRLEGEGVALDSALVATDVQEFEECAGRGTLDALERAAVLYQGDLLEGLSVEEALFEEWLIAERLRLRELALEVLARLLARQRDVGALESAVRTALRLVALDPLQEPVHRTLMRLYAELGRRGAALRQYQLCVAALQRELRAEPEGETKALYQEILQRRLTRAPASATPRAERVPIESGDVPRAISPPPPESSLIGREVELGRLRDALQSAWAGEGRLVAVTGEAGIGKSRLVAELAVEADHKGARALVGRCHESEQILPFGPWIDALRAGRLADEGGVIGALSPVWRAELARLLPEIADAPPGPPMSDPGQLFEALAQLFERVALAEPVLLILEDLHWADQMSLRLLAFIGRRLGRWRMLVVVTAREEELPGSPLLRHTLDELDQDGQLVRCSLHPLGREDSLALARTLAPPRDVAPLEEQLWRASEGNPFMIVETLRALSGRRGAAGEVTADDPPEEARPLPLPERVRNLIAYRIERLGERSRRLVAVAAVIGRPFDWALVERAAQLGEAETAEGIEELVRHRILHGRDEGFEFTHDRIREAAYGQLLAPRRSLVHRHVAEALEQLHAGELGRHTLALGTHYREGQVWAKAVLYLMQAGGQASRRYAQRDAVACYEQALAALDRLPESQETREQSADLRCRLAHSLHMAGEFARAMTRFREAEEMGVALGDNRRLAEVYAGMAYLLGSEGDFAGAIQTGLRALTIATSLGRFDLSVWTSISLGRVYYALGDYRRAIERMRWVADALNDASIEEHFGRVGLPPTSACRPWLALCLAATGDFAEALAWGGEGLRIAEAVGGPHERVWAGYCLARAHLARGEAAQAIPLLERAIALCGDQIPLFRPRVVAGLGRALTMAGDLDAALPLFAQAMAEAEAIKLLFGHAIILVWTAAAYLDTGQLAEAERYASTALELARRHGARADEAWALHALGEIAARREAPARGMALERCTQALTIARALEMAPLEARCHLSLGAVHHQSRRTAEARSEVTRAVEMFERMQMRYWLPTAEALLTETS